MIVLQTYTIRVVAKPLNDGAPTWGTSAYTATVSEDAALGAAVATTPAALDFDDPDENDVTVFNPHGLLAFQLSECCE